MTDTSTQLALKAPQIPEDAIADPADNTLLYHEWKDGLQVTHDELENPPDGFSNFLTPQIAHADAPDTWRDAGRRVEMNNRSERPFYIQVDPAEMSRQGLMYLRLKVELWNTSQPDLSASVSFITDSTPPYGQRDPNPLLITPDEITDAVLAGTGVTATVPHYDFARGDVLLLWWTSAEGNPIGALIERVPLTKNEDQFVIPAEKIREAGSGVRYVSYRLVDKANNMSNMALPTRAKVALGTLASGLKPPRVPLADDDGVLDLADARQGVFVHIEPFEGALLGDTLDLWWGSTLIPQTPAWPFPGSDLLIKISNKDMVDEYGAAKGPVDLEVAYEVRRGGVLMDSRQSHTITVDYYVGGPVDPEPEWPDPINEGLNLPVLSPPRSANNNKLLPEDAGQDATVKVLLHADNEPGQIIKFYWDDIYLSDIDHTVVVGEPGTEISKKVRWQFIEAGANGVRQLTYRVYATASENYWESLPQAVDVSAIPLPSLEFMDINDRGFLGCDSLRDSTMGQGKVVRVAVPDLSNHPEVETLHLKWVPWLEFSGDEPHKRLDKAIFIESVPIDSSHPRSGFIWEVPYDPHIKAIYDAGSIGNRFGRGRISYQHTDNGSPAGSEEVEKRVTMFVSNDPCPI